MKDADKNNGTIVSRGSGNFSSDEAKEIARLKNCLLYTSLEKGKNLKTEIQVEFDKYCMMEVDYYACKK